MILKNKMRYFFLTLPRRLHISSASVSKISVHIYVCIIPAVLQSGGHPRKINYLMSFSVQICAYLLRNRIYGYGKVAGLIPGQGTYKSQPMSAWMSGPTHQCLTLSLLTSPSLSEKKIKSKLKKKQYKFRGTLKIEP